MYRSIEIKPAKTCRSCKHIACADETPFDKESPKPQCLRNCDQSKCDCGKCMAKKIKNTCPKILNIDKSTCDYHEFR
jgi:hypothetical protein